jgi:hypothetical protein
MIPLSKAVKNDSPLSAPRTQRNTRKNKDSALFAVSAVNMAEPRLGGKPSTKAKDTI